MIKISVLSDTHFGFAAGTERENDAFDFFEEAIERSLNSDLILIAGDVFDNKKPSAETFSRVEKILNKPLLKKSELKLVEGIGKDLKSISGLAIQGIPVVAINGNHDRTVKGIQNPVESLETAGFLIHLHCNGMVFEKEKEKIAVFGMSYIPDQYAATAIKEWNPSPLKGATCIFMLHQNLAPFVLAPHTLNFEELPKGFDIYICGNMHDSKKTYVQGKPLILPGSTIPTQLNAESLNPKGFFEISAFEGKAGIRFLELESQRRVFIFDLNKETDPLEKIEKILSSGFSRKPVVKIKYTGNSQLIEKIRLSFSDTALLFFSREAPEEKVINKSMEDYKISVQDFGKRILLKNLREFNLDENIFQRIFELLTTGNEKKVMQIFEGSDGQENSR